MNKHLLKDQLGGASLGNQWSSGTYQPISQGEVRLPPGYPVCSEQDVAFRQVSSMFASVFADAVPDSAIAHADAAHERLNEAEPDPERLDHLAEEFSKLRG